MCTPATWAATASWACASGRSTRTRGSRRAGGNGCRRRPRGRRSRTTGCRGSTGRARSIDPIADRLSLVAVHQQLAWYVGGPVIGLCVVALRWLLNERLGATGAWSNAVETVSSRGVAFDTRGWLLVGLVL